jgi:acetoin utilization deacetylase AcuC-like enzyme
MILYDPQIPVSLSDFGILIPVRESRATRTFEALCRHPEIGARRLCWHQPVIEEKLTREDLARVHCPEYLGRLYSQALADEIISTYELIDPQGNCNRYAPQQAVRPLAELFEYIIRKAAGSVQCCRIALDHGFCFYFAGGMHHAHSDRGGGFCLINDIVIAARKLLSERLVQRIWIVDVDAHKGDGTASLTAGDDTIRTLSIHMAHGWPLDGPRQLKEGGPNPSFIPSDIDLPVAEGEESSYLTRLQSGLHELSRTGTADLAIVVCGADPYAYDELPSAQALKLSLDQMFARDQMVYKFLAEQKIPAAYLMAGGYGEQVWNVYAQFLIWALSRHSDPDAACDPHLIKPAASPTV